MTKKSARAVARARRRRARRADARVAGRTRTNRQPAFSELAGVLSLSSQASADVPQDIIHITLFYEQQAKDAGSLTATLNQRADAALAQAKGVSGVTAHTGAFSVYPSTDRDGKISAWRGRTEVVLESRDFAAASKLAGQLSNQMQIANVEFSLSPEAQRAAEQKLTTDAIKSFRARGRSREGVRLQQLLIRDVNVGGSRNVQPYPRMMAMAAAPMDNAKMSAPISVEGGKATVSVTVNGSVQMK
jgi:predicted secreted protein